MNGSTVRRCVAGLGFSFLLSVCLLTPALAGNPPSDATSPTGGGSGTAPAPAAPPHHGARSKAGDGTLVIYEAVTATYRVPSLKNGYWIGGLFYRNDGGVWMSAPASAGPWAVASTESIPELVRDSYPPPKAEVIAKLPSGRDAVYEPRLKVYRVADRKGVFLFGGSFYRYDSGLWLQSKTEDGPWVPGAMKVLPQVLRKAVPAAESGQNVKLPTGETVTYDADLRVFSVDGKANTILFEGAFYEKRDETWFTSPVLAAEFGKIATSDVPPPVRLKVRRPEGAARLKPDRNKVQNGANAKRKAAGARAGSGAKKPGPGKGGGARKGAAGSDKATTDTSEDDK